MIIVWDLYGGLNGSVGLALSPDKYKILTFDILEKTKDGRTNNVIDLTLPLDELITYFENQPKPNIIVGSPMCKTFSRAIAFYRGSGGYYYGEDGIVLDRPKSHFDDPIKNPNNYRYEKLMETKMFGTIAINNSVNLIKHFKPEFWYIENPKGGLIWDYIKQRLDLDGFLNETEYGAYNAPNKKPTIFFSNKELDLKKTERGWKGSIHWEKIPVKNRSDIPKELIVDIFNQFMV